MTAENVAFGQAFDLFLGANYRITNHGCLYGLFQVKVSQAARSAAA